jgi:hypothetical protein
VLFTQVMDYIHRPDCFMHRPLGVGKLPGSGLYA